MLKLKPFRLLAKNQLDDIRVARIILLMRTVIETPTFQKQADKIWAESERLEFIDWIAANPLAGDVIPGADGARKVRWGRAGSGKRGGVRIVYFNLTEQGVAILVLLYAKANQANVQPNDIEKAV
ncbi:MAG: transcriptional regulator [Sideroxydans sp.]